MNTVIEITRLTGNGKLPQIVSLNQAVEDMRSELFRKLIIDIREKYYTWSEPDVSSSLVNKLPRLVFSSLLRTKKEKKDYPEYTGLVVLSIGNLANVNEAASLRNQAAESLQTLCSFIDYSGKGICILTRFTLPDDSLPGELRLINLFHTHACLRARQYYGAQLNCFIAEQSTDLKQFFRMSYDPNLYFNPEAIPIRMEQPMKLVAEPSFFEKNKAEADPFKRLLPGYERSRAISLLYETSYQSTIEKIGSFRNADVKTFLVTLATNCFRSGIPEEDMIKYTLMRTPKIEMETEIRLTVRNVYEENKGFAGKPVISKEMLLAIRIKEFMERRYQFRYNILKGCVEYHVYRSYYFHFIPVTGRERNSICMDALEEGIPLWDKDVVRYLESNRVPLYNPLEDYLANLPVWDGKDHIRALAGQVHTSNQDWVEQFYKWFLYMVAQWTIHDEIHANSTLPVLIGKQGYHKSTFCKTLLPPELRDYYKEHLDLSKKKEAELALTRFALINLDEFDSISTSQHSFLKHLLQKTEINDRMAYQTGITRTKRYASFIGTCNRYDLLNDPTGSRRFICLELTDDFNFDTLIDYKQLYAQAKEALQKEEVYWFTNEEEEAITEANQSYQQLTVEEELFHIWFRGAYPDEKGEWLSGMEILLRLKKLSRLNLSLSRKTINRFGTELLKLKIAKKHSNKGNLYHVLQIK